MQDSRREPDFSEILGKSHRLERVLHAVKTVAPSGAIVLILGETGTGKELIARAIHKFSPRRDQIFVRADCASIPAGLIENELFGHERGAYTGATERSIGRFELAFSNFIDELSWPKYEVQHYLKARTRGLSVHALDDFISMQKDKNFAYRVLRGDADRVATQLGEAVR